MAQAGYAPIEGAVVYYLYDDNTPTGDALDAELKVLEQFVAAFNADDADINGKKASTLTAFPVARLLVTMKNHQSTHTPNEPEHITVMVVSEAQWELDPKERGGVVHVYPKDQDPAEGYDSFYIQRARKEKLNSAGIVAAIAAASANKLV